MTKAFLARYDTLAFQLGARPLSMMMDRSHVPLAEIAAPIIEAQGKLGSAKPETEALWYYMLKHAVALIQLEHKPHEILPTDKLDILHLYHKELSKRALRQFYYLLLICSREARHFKNVGGASEVIKEIKATISQGAGAALTSIPDDHHGAVAAMTSNPPNCTVGEWAKALTHCFYKGKWGSSGYGGYGGPAWGAIADILRDFVFGITPAPVMMDLGYNAAHNGGCIYNKGGFFSGFGSNFLRILDVQRSGQIPQMIAENDHGAAPYITAELKAAYKKCRDVLGDRFGGYVDWYVVEALGAKHSYPSEKQAQTAKYGVSHKAKAAEAKKQAELMAKLAQDQKDWFTVMPGLKLKKEHRP